MTYLEQVRIAREKSERKKAAIEITKNLGWQLNRELSPDYFVEIQGSDENDIMAVVYKSGYGTQSGSIRCAIRGYYSDFDGDSAYIYDYPRYGFDGFRQVNRCAVKDVRKAIFQYLV